MVSVVMAYYNRRPELINTLKSINRYIVNDLEVIIVDDGSDEDHNIDDIPKKFNYEIRLFKIDRENKNHINPCVAYNLGFLNVKNNIVIIQNPECYHNGNIIDYVIKNTNENNYISFGTYNMSENDTLKINDDYFINDFKPLNVSSDNSPNNVGWYNHSIYRATGYHFCSSISKNNLIKLNGFDNDFKDGIGWDDVEFYYRINNLGLKINLVDNPYVIHQYHYYDNKFTNLDFNFLAQKNMTLFHNKIRFNKNIKANEGSYYGHRY